MNKEEKEAVEVLKDISLEFEDVEKWAIVNFSKKEFESLRICVNLIEKQQKEIEELKKEHKIMKRIIIDNGLWETLLNDDEFVNYLEEN